MFDPITAAIGIGGASSIVGGLFQSDATKDAAETAANASRDASSLQYKMFQEQQAAMEPWRASGINALNRLNALMGLPEYVDRESGAARFIPESGPPSVARTMMSPGGTVTAFGRTYPTLNVAYPKELAAATPGRYLPARTEPTQDWRSLMDPGYEFRKQEGINALAAAGAASGNYGSGNMGVALQDFGQNLASQEFQNVYNRLAGMSGTGQVQSQAIGGMGVNTGNAMANYLNQAGQNIAQGQVAGSNALWGGVRDAGNSLASYYMFGNNGGRSPSYPDWFAASGQGDYGANGWGLGEMGNW